MTSTINNNMESPSIGVKTTPSENWRGISNQKRRRQLQNRVNQRAYKERLRQAKLARAFGQSERWQDSTILRPEDHGLQSELREKSLEIMYQDYQLHDYHDVLVDPVTREVILFVRDTLWPTFSSSWKYPASEPSLNKTWFYRILNVPIMRNAVITGTCIDIELLTGRRYPSTISRTIIELSREVRRLISQLSLENHRDTGATQEQSRPNHSLDVKYGDFSAIDAAGPEYVDDDLLFAVMHLVKATTINLLSGGVPLNTLDTTAGTFGLFAPPVLLQKLQALHLWGRACPYQIQGKIPLAQATQHLAALEYLVSLKGGLRNIKTPGFAEALHLFDVMGSSKWLTRPKFDLPGRSVRLSKHVERLRERSSRGVRLCKFDNILLGSALLDTSRDLRILCSWISVVLDSHNKHASAPAQAHSSLSTPSTEDLTTLRNLIEYRLLAFAPDPDNLVEVLADTAALLFTHGVIFPLPSRWPMEMLIQRLIDAFQGLQVQFHDAERQGFLAWVLMMGAMATADANGWERSFLVDRLAVMTGQMSISSWAEMKVILGVYLWVEWGCDAGGFDVWTMMFESGRPGELVPV